jgi:shikimate dehydrogenase
VTGAVRLGVLGEPLGHTRSPELHRAGLAALGLTGDSEAIPTGVDALKDRLAELRTLGFRGVNLTHPLKTAVLAHLDKVSDVSRRARSVNTVGFDPDGTWGDTTDGLGFLDWVASLGILPAYTRLLLLGAGGAARSIAAAWTASGAGAVVVSTRRVENASRDWFALPDIRFVTWRGGAERAALLRADVVVNATPLSGAELPLDPATIPSSTLVLDLGYGEQPSPWIEAVRARGGRAHDGLGMLVCQARHSLVRWFGAPVPLQPLARAAGWRVVGLKG